jgi:hypothetical protein
VIKKPRGQEDQSPRRAAVPEKIIIINNSTNDFYLYAISPFIFNHLLSKKYSLNLCVSDSQIQRPIDYALSSNVP